MTDARLPSGENCHRFEDSVVIVTGSTRYIGAETARRFAAEGASVVVSGRTVDQGEAVAEAIRDSGGEATYVRTDLADPSSIESLVDETVETYGTVDVLVNNAAAQISGETLETTLDEWAQSFDVNVRAQWLLAKFARPHLDDGDAIVNVSSNHAFTTVSGSFPYNVTKTAINGLTRAMALEYAPEVRVNTVNPGWILVEAPDGDEEEIQRVRDIADMHPVGRMGHPEDIAAVVAFLASDDAAFVTGAHLLADGGRGAAMGDGDVAEDLCRDDWPEGWM